MEWDNKTPNLINAGLNMRYIQWESNSYSASSLITTIQQDAHLVLVKTSLDLYKTERVDRLINPCITTVITCCPLVQSDTFYKDIHHICVWVKKTRRIWREWFHRQSWIELQKWLFLCKAKKFDCDTLWILKNSKERKNNID